MVVHSRAPFGILESQNHNLANIFMGPDPKLWKKLASIGLNSHPMGTRGKTEVKRLIEGVQYLGYEISLSQISIRPSSLARMFSNISKVLTCFKYDKNYKRHLIRLNLKISGCIINNARRGWLMFFSQTENISQLAYIDAWLKNEINKLKIDISLVKSFKKSYYEIRYNLNNTSYIPNFDKYNLIQKKEVLFSLSKKTKEEVDIMDVVSIEYEFNRLIGREISELERDIVGTFS